MSCLNSIACILVWTFRKKRESKFFSLTVDCCSMSQQGGGLEMGKMIEEQHVQVLQHHKMINTINTFGEAARTRHS